MEQRRANRVRGLTRAPAKRLAFLLSTAAFGIAVVCLAGSIAKADGDTIVIAAEADFSRMDPHTSGTWNTFKIVRHIFESFVEEDLTKSGVDSPPIVPALA